MSDFNFYFWTYISCILNAVALSWVGAILISRGKVFQIFCLAEGALLGGLAEELLRWPLFLPFAGGFSAFFTSEKLASTFRHTRYVSFIAFYLMLSSLLFFLTRTLVGHDTKIIQSLFGDLVTLLISEAKVLTFLSVAILFFLIGFGKKLVLQAFWRETVEPDKKNSLLEIIFFTVAFILLSFSITKLGLLFTLGASFIPSVFLSQSKGISLKHFFGELTFVAAVSTFFGIYASLCFPKVPTSPTVVLALSVFALVFKVKNGLRH